MTSFWDCIFPPVCIGCGKTGFFLCDACETGVWEEEQICPGCGKNSRFGLRHPWCKNRKNMSGLVCFWSYDGLVKKLVWRSKYNRYFDYMAKLTDRSIELLSRIEMQEVVKFINKNPEIVPVPIFPGKQKIRGFNQAEIIGKVLGKRLNLKVNSCLLERVKDTPKLSGKGRNERFQIMKEAFRVPEKKQVSGNKILVDDIWTTGATMNECAGVLKKAGATEIWGIALSR